MAASNWLTGFDPVISANCRLVVLGSFPGTASLKAGDYYAHPRNQFWSIISHTLNQPYLDWPFERRYAALNQAGIGLWDVIAQCKRTGSLDSNIRDPQAAQLLEILKLAPHTQALLLNGRKAQDGARRLDWGTVELIDLPSTSPANASIPAAVKLTAWCDVIRRYLQ